MAYKRLIVVLVFSMIFSILRINYTYADDETEMILNYDGKIHRYTAPPIHLVLNGQELTNLSMPPIILNDSTLVPAREVFEPLGAVVSWDDINKEVFISYEDTIILLRIGNNIVNINGEEMTVGIPPKIINNKTMIPLRFVSENLGFAVDWNTESRTAYISQPDNNLPTVEPEIEPGDENKLQSPGEITSPSLPDTDSALPTTDSTPSTTDSSPPVADSTPPITDSAEQNLDNIPMDISASPIPTKSYSHTKIVDVITPSAGEGMYIIKAESAITKVEKMFIPNNRIVIDIYNAEMAVSQSEITVNGAYVAKIRAAQNQSSPEKISRIVFELESAPDYAISISDDRKSIYVVFQNVVNELDFSSDNEADYIKIKAESQVPVNIFNLTNPDRLVIDMPYTDMNSIFERAVEGKFADKIRTGQFDEHTARIVVDLKSAVQFSISNNGSEAIIKLIEPTFRKIKYNGATKTLLISKSVDININDIKHTDLYNSGRYILTFPNDLKNILGYGVYNIGDSYLSTIEIQNNKDNKTELIFNERCVLATDIIEDDEYIYVKLLQAKEKYSKIVIIDAGHGGVDNGTSGNGLIEKNLTFDIANRVIKLLEQDGRVKPYATRTTDVKIELLDRAAFANKNGDLFVSIHINSGGTSNTKANGTESYYYPHDFDKTNNITSQQVAQIIQNQLLKHLNSLDRKVKYDNFAVIRETTIPATLLEIGFVTNPEEAAKLSTDGYRQKAAEAIFKGIIEIFETYKPRR